ncbi:MAG: hypothetical protein LBR73_08855 [Oscillospiraceae bacterium]|jgi:Na+-translocating ferredoxin:NAD+ oxidoreductase RnfA subunit|nr:hypothetical protein [Oscillospiraceae bacterium]
MKQIFEVLAAILDAGIYAVFLQNLLFSGGFGANELVSSARKKQGLLVISTMVSVSATITSVVSFLLVEHIPVLSIVGMPTLSAVFAAVLLMLYLLVGIVLFLIPFKTEELRKTALKYLPMSLLNTIVMAVPLLIFKLGETLPRAIGLGLGTGVAFACAAIIIRAGLETLRKKAHVPELFEGLPVTLIFIGIMALALTGFTGAVLNA